MTDGAGDSQPREAERRRRSRWSLFAGIAAVVIVAGGGVTYALAGGPSAPLTCQQRYDDWGNRLAGTLTQDIRGDGAVVTAAGNSTDIPGMAAALKKVGDDAAALEAYPMPACADPHGYYPQMVADFKAAGDNAGAESGPGGLRLAIDPARRAEDLAHKIGAELNTEQIITNG